MSMPTDRAHLRRSPRKREMYCGIRGIYAFRHMWPSEETAMLKNVESRFRIDIFCKFVFILFNVYMKDVWTIKLDRPMNLR